LGRKYVGGGRRETETIAASGKTQNTFQEVCRIAKVADYNKVSTIASQSIGHFVLLFLVFFFLGGRILKRRRKQ
jgi:hypothetical protein